MKLKIKTSILQDLVSKSMRGASNNKMIPLTGLMCIELKSNRLTLITTDATNYLFVSADKIEGDDFYVVVQTDLFSKLIGKLTCAEVELEVDANKLNVKGNGNYSIELPLNEEGMLITYPNPLDNITLEDTKQINLSTVQLLLNTAKAALSPTIDVQCYTGYYCGDKVVTTDTYKICGINIKLFDTPMLIDPRMMDLLDVMTNEHIEVTIKNNILVFSTPDCVVYGPTLDGIEDYQIDAISGLFDVEFTSSCKLPKAPLLQLLDRLALFVGMYDKNGVYLTFTQNGLMIASKQSSGTELISYTESNNFQPYTCCLDITMLTQQIKAQGADIIEIYYGADNAIKMVDGNVTQIVALSEDDRG